MSSLPSKEGVLELCQIAKKYRALELETQQLGQRIEADKKRYAAATEEYRRARAELIKQLEAMDCASNGNTGWEGRIAWMLGEMASHVSDLADL